MNPWIDKNNDITGKNYYHGLNSLISFSKSLISSKYFGFKKNNVYIYIEDPI